MKQGWTLRAVAHSSQSGTERSFIGGSPVLPAGVSLPTCTLCSSEQTFFALITLPSPHPWSGTSVAMFSCTACASADSLIPEMLSVPLAGARVPASFLNRYQTNFRFLAFERDSANVVPGHSDRVEFRELLTSPEPEGSIVGRVGGEPRWVMDDEAPAMVAGAKATFLFQLHPGLEFRLIDDAPPQVEIGLDGTPEPSPDGVYRLFLGNALYLWGPASPSGEVYALTQID